MEKNRIKNFLIASVSLLLVIFVSYFIFVNINKITKIGKNEIENEAIEFLTDATTFIVEDTVRNNLIDYNEEYLANLYIDNKTNFYNQYNVFPDKKIRKDSDFFNKYSLIEFEPSNIKINSISKGKNDTYYINFNINMYIITYEPVEGDASTIGQYAITSYDFEKQNLELKILQDLDGNYTYEVSEKTNEEMQSFILTWQDKNANFDKINFKNPILMKE